MDKLFVKAKQYYAVMSTLVDNDIVFTYNGEFIVIEADAGGETTEFKEDLKRIFSRKGITATVTDLEDEPIYCLISFDGHWRLRNSIEIDEDDNIPPHFHFIEKLSLSQVKELAEDIKHIISE